MDITWTVLLYLLIAAAIATFIRFYDIPVTSISESSILAVVEVFVGALIAAFLTLWMLTDGTDASITQWQIFAPVVGAAVGGIAAVKAIVGAVSTSESTAAAPPPAK